MTILDEAKAVISAARALDQVMFTPASQGARETLRIALRNYDEAARVSDWHPCLPGHAWGDDGWCNRCGAYEPEKAVKKASPDATVQELAAFALRMVAERMQFRTDAMRERHLESIGISLGFANQIINACRRASTLLETPEPAQAGLPAGGGSGSANVSAGVTGGGERALGDAGGEANSQLKGRADDPPAPPLGLTAEEMRDYFARHAARSKETPHG